MLSRPDFQIHASEERLAYFHVFFNGIFSCVINAPDAGSAEKKFKETHRSTEFDTVSIRPISPA